MRSLRPDNFRRQLNAVHLTGDFEMRKLIMILTLAVAGLTVSALNASAPTPCVPVGCVR
jgi:hypothetical protein